MGHISKYKNINLLSRAQSRYLESCLNLSDDGIKACHAKYLLTVCNNSGVSQDEFAKIAYINKSNVSRSLTALETAGFITRKPDEDDLRVIRVYPTQKALDLYPRIHKLNEEWREILTESFSKEEKELLADLTERLVEKAAKYLENF